ncbi:unnamed protein product, partial [Didymodactylos carnosus]
FDYKFTDTLPPQLQCNVTRDEYKHEESKRVSFGFIASFLNCGTIIGYDESPKAEESTRLPHKQRLRQNFDNIVKYSPDDLPPKADLRQEMTAIEDQSQIGSCSANALAGAYEYLIKKHTGRDEDVSRLFMYYNGRAQDNPSASISDTGCSMTNAIEALDEHGACRESEWPYDITKVNQRPPSDAYEEAKHFTIDEALQIKIDLFEMKSCIAQGYPFAFGIRLFKSFDKASKNGIVPVPSLSETSRSSHGSHALLAVGYSDTSQAFIVRNSWGEGWGDHGYCYIPYDYMTNSNYCFDAWTVRKLDSHDLGSDHWDNQDEVDYCFGKHEQDEDDDGQADIEEFEENDDDNDDRGRKGVRDPYSDGGGYQEGYSNDDNYYDGGENEDKQYQQQQDYGQDDFPSGNQYNY